jgi:hypothetical protein
MSEVPGLTATPNRPERGLLNIAERKLAENITKELKGRQGGR